MRKKRKSISAALCIVGMLTIILDSRAAVSAAKEGVRLCLETVIPSLFPFFVLTVPITHFLWGKKLSGRAAKALGVPVGSEGLMLVGMLAVTGKTVAALYREITEKYGTLSYEDAAITMTPARKQALMELLFVERRVPEFEEAVEKISYEDGCKVYFTDGSWVICRFSGTEPLLRMAAEGRTPQQARQYIRLWRELMEL